MFVDYLYMISSYMITHLEIIILQYCMDRIARFWNNVPDGVVTHPKKVTE